jgi:hypothetical protein
MIFITNLLLILLRSKSPNKLFSLCIFTFLIVICAKGSYHYYKFFWFGLSCAYIALNVEPINKKKSLPITKNSWFIHIKQRSMKDPYWNNH